MDGYRQTIICLGEGTFRFEAKPGQLSYIGNIAYRDGRVGRDRFDLSGAKAALASYPNVQGELERVEVADATFRSGTDIFGAGDYVTELGKE
jgi:hypothetical protein